MIKALVLGFLIFLILALLTGIWGQLQRIQMILERGIWQHDQYLAKLNETVISAFDKQNEILIDAVNKMKGDNENGKL